MDFDSLASVKIYVLLRHKRPHLFYGLLRSLKSKIKKTKLFSAANHRRSQYELAIVLVTARW